jgi:hypothetical protein
MAIIKADFARDCVNQGLFLGVNPHFLLAVADVLSGINDDTVSGKVGPFRITQADWDAQLSDPNLDGVQKTDINSPGQQTLFAAVQALNAQDKLVKSLKRFPSANELYKEWPKTPALPGGTLQGSLDNTRSLVLPAVQEALAGMDDGDLVNGVNLASITPAARRKSAEMIVTAFADAGFGKAQQVAAVANAIAESNLNPDVVNKTATEHSVGLFQLNIKGGVGAGHTEDELKDPAKNISLIIAKAKTIPEFKTVTDLHDAVAIFVQKIEQPANQAGEIIKRLSIALQIKA